MVVVVLVIGDQNVQGSKYRNKVLSEINQTTVAINTDILNG
jgi:hypothetical protein